MSASVRRSESIWAPIGRFGRSSANCLLIRWNCSLGPFRAISDCSTFAPAVFHGQCTAAIPGPGLLSVSGSSGRGTLLSVLEASLYCTEMGSASRELLRLPTVGSNDVRSAWKLVDDACMQDNLQIFPLPTFRESLHQCRDGLACWLGTRRQRAYLRVRFPRL